MLCTEIVSDIQNNFCTQHVLPMFCKKKSFWQRFTCTTVQWLWSVKSHYSNMPNCRTFNVKVCSSKTIRSFKIFIFFKCEFRFVLPFGKTRAQNFELRNWEVTYLTTWKLQCETKFNEGFLVFWVGATANPSKSVDWKWSTDKGAFIIKWLFRNPFFSKHTSFNQFFVSTYLRKTSCMYLNTYLVSKSMHRIAYSWFHEFWRGMLLLVKKNYDQLRDKNLVSHFLFCIVI